MTDLRLAMIGCGQIAEFHAPAFREAGFELAAVCSRPGSERLDPFAERHGIPRRFDRLADLLAARSEWDAALVAVPVDATLEVLTGLLETGAPVLVEKPVTRHSAEVQPLVSRDLPIIVGYNRRFYPMVNEAREEAAVGGPFLARMELPEGVRVSSAPDDPRYLDRVFTNSVHGFDMLRFVFGDLRVAHVHRIVGDAGVLYGFAAMLEADGGAIEVTGAWQAPANFALTIDRPGRRVELRPFESGQVYEGMEVVQPTAERPLRSYRPKHVRTMGLEGNDVRFKPGFVAQAQALAALARGEDPGHAARLVDTYEALRLAEQFVGEAYA